MMHQRFIRTLIIGALVAGCDRTLTPTSPTGSVISKVQITPGSVTLHAGQTTTLTATAVDSSGHALSGGTMTWATSNATVATVTGAGVVTALKTGGATISASEDGVTAGATVTVNPIPVATVTVAPASASVTLGNSVQLNATLKDSLGNTLTGRTVTWTTNKATVATVNGSGLVAGLTVGSATIAAASEGKGGSSTVTVLAAPPPPSPGWNNEPSGMTVRSDWGMDIAPATSGDVPITGSNGWHIVDNASSGSGRGWTQMVSDATAPQSAPSVYDFVYPQGMVEGNAPSTVYFNGLSNNEVYVGFWWKASSPFDTGPDGNKIAFIFNGGGAGGGQQFLILKGDMKLHVLPEYPGDYKWRDPNVTATTVSLGAWHKIEWYSNVSTGVMKYWMDGVLQGSYTDVKNPVQFDMFQFSPTWGGNIGATKKETDHYWFDQVHLSTR